MKYVISFSCAVGLALCFLVAEGIGAEENLFVLPGAASTAGAAGTHWLSDLEVLNPGSSEEGILIRFLPFGSDDPSGESFQIRSGELRVFSDIVGQLGREGAGILEISSAGPLMLGMRTYNRSDTSTYGQYISGETVILQGFKQEYGAAFLPGALENGNFRSNIGIYNPKDSAVSFRIDEMDSSLAAHHGWQRRASDFISFDGEGDTLRIEGDPVVSYLSVIDNETGDPTFISPSEPGISGVLIGVAHQAGAEGSIWRSDLFLHAEEATTVLLDFQEWNAASGPGTTIRLGAGETRVLRDVVSLMTEEEKGGVLSYTATHPVSVSARTYNESEEGSFGQGIKSADLMEEGFFLFVGEDDTFRSNLALYNPGDAPGNYTMELYANDGEVLAAIDVAVPAHSAKQFNHVIRNFGLQQLASGYLRVSGSLFGGYVSFIDNASGDASTVLPMEPVPLTRVSGAAIFGEITSFGGDETQAGISIFDAGDFSLLSRLSPDSRGRFSAALPGAGAYWIVVGTPGGFSSGKWVEVGDFPVEVRMLLGPSDEYSKSRPVAPRGSGKDQIGTGTVSVVVLDACTDEGIVHADVRLINIATGLIVAAEETRPDGRVTFNDVPVSDDDTAGGLVSPYMVIAGGWALNDYEACHYGKVLLGVGDIAEIEIKMMPKEDQDGCYGHIQGRIMDDCVGEPLAGAEVRIVNGLDGAGCEDSMEEFETTYTDSAGYFALEKVVPGAVQLMVGEPSVDESFGGCLACYWAQYRNLDVVKGETNTADFSLKRKGIVFLGQVREREYGDPVDYARVDFVNPNPRASQHGPLFTREDGVFIFSIPTAPAFQGVTSGTLDVHLTDFEDRNCTSDESFDICEWEYDEQLILSCGEEWSGSYTTTITYSESLGDATLTKNGTATGEFSFSVDSEGNINGSADDNQLITATTPGCTTTWNGGGVFEITGQAVAGSLERLFFDDQESFTYVVTTECEGAPPFSETRTGSAELQYAPMIEVQKSGDGRSIHFEDTHTVEHIGTYTIVLDATRN